MEMITNSMVPDGISALLRIWPTCQYEVAQMFVAQRYGAVLTKREFDLVRSALGLGQPQLNDDLLNVVKLAIVEKCCVVGTSWLSEDSAKIAIIREVQSIVPADQQSLVPSYVEAASESVLLVQKDLPGLLALRDNLRKVCEQIQ